MKRLHLLFFVLAATCSVKLAANGGPDDGSIVTRVGDPHFVKMKDVELVSEKIRMKVEGDYTNIHVTYRLHNKSSSPTGKIHYGFPVEYTYSDCCDTVWDERYLNSIAFAYNGKPLAILGSSNSAVENSAKMEIEIILDDESSNFDEYSSLFRKWFYTEFSLAADELATLEVSYKVLNHYTDYSTSKSFFSYYDPRQLYYDFSPASYWGSGMVKDFQLSIEADEELKIKGLPMSKEGNTYTYSTANFNLAEATPLKIWYNVNDSKQSSYINAHRLKPNQIRSIKASSTLKGYDVKSLLDGDFSTAWVEGKAGLGIGEWVEIELEKDVPISAIVIVNGYTKSERTYTANSKAKKLTLSLVRNIPASQSYSLSEPDEDYSLAAELKNIPFRQISHTNFAALASEVLDFGDSSYTVSKIRISIDDIYKGSSYDDTCITEIFLLGYSHSDFNDYN